VRYVAGIPHLLKNSALYIGLIYPTPLALAGLVGVWVLLRRRDTMAVLLLILAAVYFVWAARYDVPDQYGFFVPFYVTASILIGVGAARWAEGSRAWVRWAMVVLALVPVGVYAVLPGVAKREQWVTFQRELPYRDSYTYLLQPWRRGDLGARQFAEEVIRAVPKGAVVLADTTSSPPLKCVLDVEQSQTSVPSDLLIVDPYGAKFDESLAPYWGEEDLLPTLTARVRRLERKAVHAEVGEQVPRAARAVRPDAGRSAASV